MKMRTQPILNAAFVIVALFSFSGHAWAQTYVVNDSSDPEDGTPGSCIDPASTDCTLRDALAAADATAGLDIIVFDVDSTIFIRKPLTAIQPVVIDGGAGKTIIRVDQGYYIKLLDDRPAFGSGQVMVLQPTYYSQGGATHPMLALLGPGSTVTHMVLDGSITPSPGDPGVARIDFQSDDTTDFFLYTIDGRDGQPRWLVGGGLRVPAGSVIDNEVRHVSDAGILVENAAPRVLGNLVWGGAVGQPYFSGDGIRVAIAANAEVDGNNVSGYRTGVSISYTSGVAVTNNDVSGNETGISLDTSDDSYGSNVIDDNDVSGNLALGVVVYQVSGATVSNNRVASTGHVAIRLGEAERITVSDNDVDDNGTDSTFDGGILVGDGPTFGNDIRGNKVTGSSGFGIAVVASYGSTIRDNTLKRNGGAGIVLFGYAQSNGIENNKAYDNDFGVLSLSSDGVNFPRYNTIGYNTLKHNATADAADDNGVCENAWTNNDFDTSLSGSPGCIQ